MSSDATQELTEQYFEAQVSDSLSAPLIDLTYEGSFYDGDYQLYYTTTDSVLTNQDIVIHVNNLRETIAGSTGSWPPNFPEYLESAVCGVKPPDEDTDDVTAIELVSEEFPAAISAEALPCPPAKYNRKKRSYRHGATYPISQIRRAADRYEETGERPPHHMMDHWEHLMPSSIPAELDRPDDLGEYDETLARNLNIAAAFAEHDTDWLGAAIERTASVEGSSAEFEVVLPETSHTLEYTFEIPQPASVDDSSSSACEAFERLVELANGSPQFIPSLSTEDLVIMPCWEVDSEVSLGKDTSLGWWVLVPREAATQPSVTIEPSLLTRVFNALPY